MSLLKLASLQIGKSGTASNNFHWRNLLDGTLRLTRGNADAPISQVMLVNADNSVNFPAGVADARTLQDVTASRALNVTYTNTDKMPRVLYLRAGQGTVANSHWNLYIDGTVRMLSTQAYTASAVMVIQGVEVPAGSTYKLEPVVGAIAPGMWSEFKQ